MSESGPIIEFSTDRTVIRLGEHATLRWRVQGVQAVYLFREGQPWQKHGVVGEGERQVSPAETATWRLRVVKVDNSVDVRKIQIQVQAGGPLQSFVVDRTQIGRGECVTFRWHVEGVKAVYFFPEGERWQDHGVVGVGEQQVCPSQTTTYCLQVVHRDNSVEVHKIAVQVWAQGPLQSFSADRTEIGRGECVTFRWHVEGVKAVYFFPEGARWEDHGVVGVGEKQVCPAQTTTYCLRVVQVDGSLEHHYITVQVKG